MEEMQIKEDAPLFSRPSSPDRKYIRTLADIPEAIPGPNAFAQQAARMDRHRLDGNAFYQQEMQKRLVGPPATIHPALRPRSKSDPPTPPRDSLCTTFSPFINAHDAVLEDSPPLKLVPSTANLALPTMRGHVEERREQMQNQGDGSTERVAVFMPAPKIASADFAKSTTATPGKGVDHEPSNIDLAPSKTPKKGFFGRLKLTTNLRGTSSPSSTVASSETVPASHYDGSMPVKAQAVLGGPSPSKTRKSLGSSPPKTGIPRSPSKRKGFFSRKNGSLAEIHEQAPDLHLPAAAEHEKAPQSASTLTKTPKTALSDPTDYSYHSKRIISQSNSDKGGEKEKQANHCAVARSQSLKYFDHSIPPTPPAKNTPPEEKAKRGPTLANNSSRVPFYDMRNGQSKEPVGMISTSGRVSPTRFGSYGHKEMPTLVTKPSVYSLHASVVPNLLEASTFEEMKARIDGLGLEGFNMPPENVRLSKMAEMYSPSIYSSDWENRPNTVVITPQIQELTKSPNGESTHTKGSSSSGGEIAICYPELAKDPSVNSLEALRGGVGIKRPQNTVHAPHAPLHGVTQLHGMTHSQDHNSPHQSVDSLIESSIFAHHARDVSTENIFDSPSSFKCPSAAPSPLQLPRTTFSPPPRSTSKLAPNTKGGNDTSQDFSSYGGGLGIHQRSDSATVTPSKRNEVFDKAPSFPAPAGHNRSRSASPQSNSASHARASDCDVDPQKQTPRKMPSGDKLDRMIDMLNKLHERNNEIGMIREEIRATNERLDQRLAAVETLHRASPAPSYALDESLINEKAAYDVDATRVPTDVAHEFYKSVEGSESEKGEQESMSEQADSDNIAELKETYKSLLEMVGGFAEKIQALERKNGGRS